MRILSVFLFLFFVTPIWGQSIGVKIGATTVTPTGNNDQFDFDFGESFSPGYQVSFLGNYDLSDIIILKPTITYRQYTIKQDLFLYTNNYTVEQTHNTLGLDLNFDIELRSNLSFIFGMGIDYITAIKTLTQINSLEETSNLDLGEMTIDQLIDPYSNVGLCFKFSSTFFVDLEYRHLLDNWGTGGVVPGSQFISSNNGSVKLHMINLSLGLLF